MMMPIVLVPSLLCTAEVFAPQVTALWPHGHITIASTLECNTIAAAAASILAAAPPKFALAGLSQGGYICFEIFRQAPDRVIRLALLDTTARPATPEQAVQRRAAILEARTVGYEKVAVSMLNALFHPSRSNDAALQAVNLRMARTVGLDGFTRQVEAGITRVDSRPTLSAISVPTLVLVGDSDPLTPVALSEEIAAGIAHSRLVIVPHCGHGSTLERPELVNSALTEWITAPDGG